VSAVALAMIAVMLLVAVAAGSLFWPLRRNQDDPAHVNDDISLDTARDAKLRELDDLELDLRLGKLSAEDFDAVNAVVRGEAIEIIRRIDSGAAGGEPASGGQST
jgi:hypothetical protein